MSLGECIRSAARNWLLLLLCALTASLATLGLTSLKTREYRSTTQLVVGPAANLTKWSHIWQTVDELSKRSVVTTFAEVIDSHRIFQEAAAQVGLSREGAASYSVSAVAQPEANVVLLDVQGPRRTTTAALSTAVASAATGYIDDFYKIYSLRPLDVAHTPRAPVAPHPMRDTALAGLGGLGLGFFLGLLRDRFRNRRGPPIARSDDDAAAGLR